MQVFRFVINPGLMAHLQFSLISIFIHLQRQTGLKVAKEAEEKGSFEFLTPELITNIFK